MDQTEQTKVIPQVIDGIRFMIVLAQTFTAIGRGYTETTCRKLVSDFMSEQFKTTALAYAIHESCANSLEGAWVELFDFPDYGIWYDSERSKWVLKQRQTTWILV